MPLWVWVLVVTFWALAVCAVLTVGDMRVSRKGRR